MRHNILLAVLSMGLFVSVAANSQASVISPQGILLDGVTMTDSVSSSGTASDPETARFWTFFGNQGDLVTIEARRLEIDLDPAMWVFEGTFSDTVEFGGFFDSGDPGFLDFADDEIPNPGPFGDPRAIINLTLPGTGQYTVAITNFASGPDDGGDGRFDYEIVAFGTVGVIPEPTMFLVWAGLACCGAVKRRRR